MGFMFLLKKFGLLFLLLSASLFSTTSFAGRHYSKLVGNLHKEGRTAGDDGHENLRQEEVVERIHERLLKVNTKDYGRYDPSPTLGKPPFKLIPN